MSDVEFLPLVKRRVSEIMSACHTLAQRLKSYPIDPLIKPDVVAEIKEIKSASLDLYRLISIPENSMKVSCIDRPGWDFLPWFDEKTSRVRKATYELSLMLTEDPDSVAVNPDAKLTSRQLFRELIAIQVGEMLHCAEALNELAQSDLLRLTQKP